MKSKKIVVSSMVLGTLLVPIISESTVSANTWKANTPSEIAELNKNGTYTVRKGDTVWAIGMHFNIKPDVIESMNSINDPYDLQIGTILQLHIYDHGKKAKFTITNAEGIEVQKTLTNSDKLDKKKNFNNTINSKELTKTETKSINKEKSIKSSKEEHSSNASSSTITSSMASNNSSTSTSSTKKQNVINTPQEAIQAAINKYGTDNGKWRWACMATGDFNDPQYKWSNNQNVNNNDQNGYFIVRNYLKNDPNSTDGGLINTYFVYPNGKIVQGNF